MADFAALFGELRQAMLRAAPQMMVSRDDAQTLDLTAPSGNPVRPGAPMWFGAVRLGKRYVSVHLMPIYTHPALAAAVPDRLKPRMQGKSCFNFKVLTAEQLGDLETLARACAEAYAPHARGALRSGGDR